MTDYCPKPSEVLAFDMDAQPVIPISEVITLDGGALLRAVAEKIDAAAAGSEPAINLTDAFRWLVEGHRCALVNVTTDAVGTALSSIEAVLQRRTRVELGPEFSDWDVHAVLGIATSTIRDFGADLESRDARWADCLIVATCRIMERDALARLRARNFVGLAAPASVLAH